MRFETVKWAFDAPVNKSTVKFVLVLMASHGDAINCFNRSTPYIADKTQLDRKTVIKAIANLVEAGFIVDTGKRCGPTGATKIYQLIVTETHQEGELSSANNGTAFGADTSIKLSTSRPKNGTSKQTQKRVCLEQSRPKNGTTKQSQKRYSVLKDLLYIKKQPLLNIIATELWITYLQNNWHDEFMVISLDHLIDIQITFGDHHRQMWVVKNSINKKWKHLHADNSGVSKNGNKILKEIRQSSGLASGVN